MDSVFTIELFYFPFGCFYYAYFAWLDVYVVLDLSNLVLIHNDESIPNGLFPSDIDHVNFQLLVDLLLDFEPLQCFHFHFLFCLFPFRLFYVCLLLLFDVVYFIQGVDLAFLVYYVI